MSQYLNRHIVNIPLGRIKTNSQLMSLLFNTKFHLDDSGVPRELKFDQLIFILEDVDAESPVVKNRALVQAAKSQTDDQEEAPDDKDDFGGLILKHAFM